MLGYSQYKFFRKEDVQQLQMKSLFVLFGAFLIIFSNSQTTTRMVGSVSGGTTVGGFSAVTNQSDGMYLYALNQVLNQNPGIISWKLISAQQQIVSGVNYRFTFKDNRDRISQYLIYVPLNYQTTNEVGPSSSQTSTLPKGSSSSGNMAGNSFLSRENPYIRTSNLESIPKVAQGTQKINSLISSSLPQIQSDQSLRNYY